MSEKIQAVRGMNDLLPQDSVSYTFIKNTITEVLTSFGYEYIRTPIVEKTTVFHRAIGGDTDVVSKEMYSWQDGKENLSLRPEGTAGVVRSMIQSNLPREGVQKLFYHGAMFRHERPQKGRYRQFFQFGVEVFGLEKPKIDAELLLITHTIWQKLGISATLEINSLGSSEERATYKQQLVQYFQEHKENLDEDSVRRLTTNPLRILDSKNPSLQTIIANAPKLLDSLGEESRREFEELLRYLDATKINYTINQTLVRGLDYYNKTVFEWVSDELGAQGTICAGGRYDSLVEKMGGNSTPAIGFAIGMERLSLLVAKEIPKKTSIYICAMGEAAQLKSLQISQILTQNNHLIVYNDCSLTGFKSQLKKADKKNCDYAVIIGEDEVQNNCVVVKSLTTNIDQQTVKDSELEIFIQNIIE
jgi:histidyl-tRNA synthetase